jgi:hypothetical protein
MSLKEVYDEAEKQRLLYHETSDAEALEKAISGYEASMKLINQLALFSDNELFEDLTDSDARYLLAEFQLAELVQERRDLTKRKEALLHAQLLYKAFLQRCLDYEIVPGSSKNAVRAALKGEVKSRDAAARRQDKIDQFRRERDLEKTLAGLQDRNDPEHLRETYTTAIELAVSKSLPGLEAIENELKVLAMAPDPAAASRTISDPNERRAASQDAKDWRLDAPRDTGLLDKSGRVSLVSA